MFSELAYTFAFLSLYFVFSVLNDVFIDLLIKSPQVFFFLLFLVFFFYDLESFHFFLLSFLKTNLSFYC